MNVEESLKVARDPKRLSVLQKLNLLDTPAEEAFDRLTRLASKITHSPISLVSLVDADRQFFKSLFGLPEPLASERETPLSHSFCKHVVADRQPLVVEDARQHPVLRENLAVPDFGVIGYLGMPLTTTEGVELGSFCVIDTSPRKWTDDEIEIVRELALSVMTEIELRARIEELQKAEVELARSNEALEQYAHIISHDLKEPLRKIMIFGSRLYAKYGNLVDEIGADYFARMQSAAERMQGLIQDLLTLSKVSTHGQTFVRVNLNELIQEVLVDLELRIEQSQAQVEVGDLPQIEADPTQMRQLLQNLISNALKFHQPGKRPFVHISGELVQKPDGTMCQLKITDHGIGIDMAYQERIFETFARLHTRSEIEGTGIGLTICRRIVERHGGTIAVESVPDEGTTFTVTLPHR